MKRISWNVNGIRDCVKKGFLSWLQKTPPDIICLQETKAHKDQLSGEILTPIGYKSYWAETQKRVTQV